MRVVYYDEVAKYSELSDEGKKTVDRLRAKIEEKMKFEFKGSKASNRFNKFYTKETTSD